MKYFASSLVAAALVLLSAGSWAGELNGVKMDDSIEVDGKKLELNGMGLRKVTRFGIPVKVYVAGLYVEKKSQDSDAILAAEGVKRLVMEMLLAVDRDPMIEAFEKSFTENCVAECETARKQFTQFKAQIVSTRKKDRLVFTYYPDKVEFEVIGANAKKVTLEGATMSKNILALFINKKQPPTPEFRSGLLGL